MTWLEFILRMAVEGDQGLWNGYMVNSKKISIFFFLMKQPFIQKRFRSVNHQVSSQIFGWIGMP